ncbi:MAG: hypothetical protein U0271_12350 [Polyangiaceae bacterium]
MTRREPSGESPYVVSRAYDWAFFLLPPIGMLALAALAAYAGVEGSRLSLGGRRTTYWALATGVLTHAHLVAVFFRSHGNGSIRRRHPLRFLVVPPVLVAAIAISPAAAIVSSVVVVFWDVYHSALQTFGFARIYDQRAGNGPRVGRRLDLMLNLVLYAGPILGGATMLAHVGKLEDLSDVGATFFTRVPVSMSNHHATIARVVALGLTLAVVVYVLGYVRLARQGYRVSPPKVFLVASTGFCSVVAWGLNPWGLAFAIMNIFHAVQYLALVWWSEGRRLATARRLPGRVAGLAVYLVLVLAYGFAADRADVDDRVLWAVAQTVALMHFWYDGFVWSVTRKDVSAPT